MRVTEARDICSLGLLIGGDAMKVPHVVFLLVICSPAFRSPPPIWGDGARDGAATLSVVSTIETK